ncbi:uncharacterized protein LOC133181560 [Saccostrea echinata]|uniref:uncharacterized protein LOC133181560 n=1 Tax=Saccostrea echinata TaxID=191078 RepID=UPI002A83A7E8|nr:uncharacterized protein LOC133181560 [Saccostrea echinata]
MKFWMLAVSLAAILSFTQGFDVLTRSKRTAVERHIKVRQEEKYDMDYLIFNYGDTNKDGLLSEEEVRKLFNCGTFAPHVNDIILKLRKPDGSLSMDIAAWRAVVFTEADMKDLTRSPYVLILSRNNK